MLTPKRNNLLPTATPYAAQEANSTLTAGSEHFSNYSPVRKISRNPSDESFEFLRRAPRKNRDDMPDELKVLHAEVARYSSTAKKLTFDENGSESTQSTSPKVNAFTLDTNSYFATPVVESAKPSEF